MRCTEVIANNTVASRKTLLGVTKSSLSFFYDITL